MTSRHVPIFSHLGLRTGAGLVLAALAPVAAAALLNRPGPGLGLVAAFVLLLWLPAALLTDKYRHKYPQRYWTYLLASHLKAAVVMAVILAALGLVAGTRAAPPGVLWTGLGLLILADGLLSAPRRRVEAPARPRPLAPAPAAAGTPPPDGASLPGVDTAAILARLGADPQDALVAFVRANLPADQGGSGDVAIVSDIPEGGGPAGSVGLLVGRTRLNDVLRLNRFVEYCAGRVAMGGYLAVSYTPLEHVTEEMKRRHPRWLRGPVYLAHFLWYRAIPKVPWLDLVYFSPPFRWLDRVVLGVTKRRNRALPKAEAWGRLAYWGFEVVAESQGEGDRQVLAQRTSPPVSNRRPSYYAVVALEKVGLDGELIRLHKVRSMYPFSEFLQRRIHQTHGLTATGKFKNDFRLTEYGKLIRRHWIDELPGLFDWLRGDVKLVGMRATSPAFLSTYPPGFYELYVRAKPGLVPPIFDEQTGGFEEIVRVESEYLKRYCQAPIRTDLAYFWYTFRDIVFRRVRSH